MSELTGKEKKLFRMIHKKFKGNEPSMAEIHSFFLGGLSFSKEISDELYMLWFLNHREDGDYEGVEVNRDKTPILTILKRIQSGDLVEEDIPSLFYEEPISFCENRGYYSESNLPCVSIDSSEVTLKLEREQWEEQNISGLHEEDLWKYYEATSYGSGDYYEEYDSSEFDYVQFNDETLKHISQIAYASNRQDIVNYINDTEKIESEKLAEYLEDLLPDDKFDTLRSDYLYDIGYETTRVRNNETEKTYKEEVKYPRTGNDYEIEIPIDEFIEMVIEQKPRNFAEFLDLEINPEIDLESGYHDEGYWSSDGFTEHIDTLNSNLEKLSVEYSDGSLAEYHDTMGKFKKLMDATGIGVNGKDYRKGTRYISKDSRLEFFQNGIDVLGGTIEFTYDGIDHKIALEEFINWAQGSVLDLKESIRKILRKEINESIKLPIEIGDTVLMGKFKNKKTVVKDIEWNEKGDLMINGKSALRMRIVKKAKKTKKG